MEKTIIKIILLLKLVDLSVQISCSGGAIFLSDEKTYQIPLSYECGNERSLRDKIDKLKAKVSDPFVKFYLSEHRVKRIIESSGDGSDDNEDEEEEEEDYEQVLTHEVPIMPTPVLTSSDPTSHITEINQITSITTTKVEQLETRSRIHPTRSYSIMTEKSELIYIGSGDGPLLSTPIYQPTTENYDTSSTTEKTLTSQTPQQKRVIKLQKQILQAGVKHEQKINAKCTEIKNIENQKVPNWLTLINERNSETLILSLPTNEDVSDYSYMVECEEVNYEIYYSVRQRQRSRNWNHLFRIDYGTVERGLDSFVRFIEFVRNSDNQEDLVLLRVGRDSFPYFIEFVNETIVARGVALGSCPVELLKQTLKELQSKTLKPENYSIKSIQLKRLNSICDDEDFNTINEIETVEKKINYPPAIKNQIDKINGQVGKYLVYKIKQDFCYDPEDGETNRLKLSLKNLKDFNAFSENFWVQFDWKNQEIFGLPMNKQIINAVVVCEDKGGKTAQDVLEIEIITPERKQYSAEFNLHFESIPFTPPAIRKFIEKLTQILSDEIEVKSFSESNGHVHFKWFNTSNPSTELELTTIRKILFADEGGVQKNVKMAFAPEFNLTSSGGVVPVGGVLLAGNTPVESGGGDIKYFDFDQGQNVDSQEDNWKNNDFNNNGGSSEAQDFNSAYLTTYIIPSILIAVMILLALIIACLLSRKRKNNLDGDLDERKNFVSNVVKGQVPVIFQEELDYQQQQQKQMHQAPTLPPTYHQIRQMGQPPRFQNHQQRGYPAESPGHPPSYQPPPALYNSGNSRNNNPPLYHSNRYHTHVPPYVPP